MNIWRAGQTAAVLIEEGANSPTWKTENEPEAVNFA
jgi:hypothetical protein